MKDTFQTTLQPTDDGLKQPYQSRACPHCGSMRQQTVGVPGNGNTFIYAIRCTNCGARGPECMSSSDARPSWEWRVK